MEIEDNKGPESWCCTYRVDTFFSNLELCYYSKQERFVVFKQAIPRYRDPETYS